MTRFSLRFSALTLLIAAAGTISACNTGVANPASGLHMVGTYQLVAVDGTDLPAQTDSGIFVRGSLIIGSDVKFTLSQTDSSAGTTSTFTASGQWTVLGNNLTLIASNSSVYAATLSLSQDTVTVPVNGHTSTFAK
ncbi:MAG: hypothetical protein WBQ26_12910 [Gemmatimonadaceae bacterium]|nr:hypothetical protein [Gemmatimonadaceae bacterium]